MGFPGGASGKEPTCQCGRCQRHGFDPWVGKIPWRRAQQLTPVFFPGESHGQRNLAGCRVAKRLSMHTQGKISYSKTSCSMPIYPWFYIFKK